MIIWHRITEIRQTENWRTLGLYLLKQFVKLLHIFHFPGSRASGRSIVVFNSSLRRGPLLYSRWLNASYVINLINLVVLMQKSQPVIESTPKRSASRYSRGQYNLAHQCALDSLLQMLLKLHPMPADWLPYLSHSYTAEPSTILFLPPPSLPHSPFVKPAPTPA